MAEAVGAVRIDLFANLAEWTTGLNKAEGHLNRFAKNTDRTSKQIISAGRNLTLGLSAPIVAFGALALKASADAEALRGDIALSFGAAADDVNAWAETTGDALGRSTQQIQRAALSFQQLFEDIAPTEEAAAELSMRFTELSQDFAAFNNVSSEQGVKALQGALAGAGKAVKRLGVDISDGAVQQKAYELGIAATNVELTEQQKTLARAAIISEGFSKIQGDIVNDQDEAAEQTARLRGEFEEMQVALGDELLPIYKELLGGILELVRGFKTLSPELRGAIVTTAGLAAAIGPALLVVGGLTKGVGIAAKVVGALGLTFLGAGKNADSLGGKLGGLALRFTAAAGAAYGLGTAVGLALNEVIGPDLDKEIERGNRMKQSLERIGLSAEEARQAVKFYYAELAAGRSPTEQDIILQGKLIAKRQEQDAALEAAKKRLADTQAEGEAKKAIDELITGLGDLGGKTDKQADKYANLREQLDPVGTALRQYKTDLTDAVKLGFDQEQAQVTLGKAFLDSVKDVEGFRDALKSLPPEIQALQARRDQIALFIQTWGQMAEANAAALEKEKELDAKRAQIAADGVQAGQDAIDAIMDYGRSLTEQFDPMAVFEARLRGINEAFALGAISAATYEKAKAAAFAETPEGQQQVDIIRSVTDELTSAALGAQSLGDAIEDLILEMLEMQVIRPMIQNAVSGFFPQVAPIMQTPGASGGFDFSQAIGAAASFLGFGGSRDSGGPVMPGMSYRIGSGVQEEFTPSVPGTITRGPGNPGSGANVTFNVNAADPNAFRASERQMTRRARRQLGV